MPQPFLVIENFRVKKNEDVPLCLIPIFQINLHIQMQAQFFRLKFFWAMMEFTKVMTKLGVFIKKLFFIFLQMYHRIPQKELLLFFLGL